MLVFDRWSCWHVARHGSSRPSQRSKHHTRNVWRRTKRLSETQGAGLCNKQGSYDNSSNVGSKLFIAFDYREFKKLIVCRFLSMTFPLIFPSSRLSKQDKLSQEFQCFPFTHRKAKSLSSCLSALKLQLCIKTALELWSKIILWNSMPVQTTWNGIESE